MSAGICNDTLFDMQRKLNNATMSIANDKRINEDMKKQIKKNEKEKKALKDEKHALKNRLLKSTDDNELMRDELSHIAMIDNNNNNNECQIKKQQLEAELHEK